MTDTLLLGQTLNWQLLLDRKTVREWFYWKCIGWNFIFSVLGTVALVSEDWGLWTPGQYPDQAGQARARGNLLILGRGGPWPYQCFVRVLEYYLLVIPYKTSIKQQFSEETRIRWGRGLCSAVLHFCNLQCILVAFFVFVYPKVSCGTCVLSIDMRCI